MQKWISHRNEYTLDQRKILFYPGKIFKTRDTSRNPCSHQSAISCCFTMHVFLQRMVDVVLGNCLQTIQSWNHPGAKLSSSSSERLFGRLLFVPDKRKHSISQYFASVGCCPHKMDCILKKKSSSFLRESYQVQSDETEVLFELKLWRQP